MNTVFDFAPLWRSGIGFDHLTDLLGQAAKVDQTDKYPPYDIEKTGEDVYRLTLALAGWKPDEITLITEPNVLVVAGQKADPENNEYLYRGIPTVAFDLSAMQSSLVGGSGERLRAALQVVDAISQGKSLWIATCNSITSLPPELRRRFTLGTFFFDLPSAEEREAIWKIYLAKWNLEGERPNDEGWTGAEIRECCRKAWRFRNLKAMN